MNPAEPQPVTPKRRLRWYHCRLRFLLVVALICSILYLCLVFWMQKERREREAAWRVGYLGGDVCYVSKSEWELMRSGRGPGLPLSRAAPDLPVLADGYEVSFRREGTTNLSLGTTDARLAKIPFQDLSPLRTLDLARTNVTDAGLTPLQGLNQLLALDLAGGIVSDVGLTYLERLTQLQLLNLEDTKVTDDGLEHLKGLTQLQSLGLNGTRVTEKGRAKLKKVLPKCEINWSPPTKDERQRRAVSD